MAAPIRQSAGRSTWLPNAVQFRCEAPVTKPSRANPSARGSSGSLSVLSTRVRPGAARDFEPVAEDAEPGHVGEAWTAGSAARSVPTLFSRVVVATKSR